METVLPTGAQTCSGPPCMGSLLSPGPQHRRGLGATWSLSELQLCLYSCSSELPTWFRLRPVTYWLPDLGQVPTQSSHPRDV